MKEIYCIKLCSQWKFPSGRVHDQFWLHVEINLAIYKEGMKNKL
jgi:hypothetical protein